MNNQSFGPRKVEGQAVRRWAKEGFKLWKRTASTVLPMTSVYVLAFATLMINMSNPYVFIKLVFLLVLLGGCAALWKSGLLMVNQEAFEGKKVALADVKQGVLVLLNKKKLLSRIMLSDLIIVGLMMLIVMWMSFSLLKDAPAQTAISAPNWLETSVLLNTAALLTIVMTWQNMGIFALVNSLSICKAGLDDFQTLRILEYRAMKLNPFIRRIELMMGPMICILMVISLMIPFVFVLFILLESFIVSFSTVAFKDIFEGKKLVEVKEEVTEKLPNVVLN